MKKWLVGLLLPLLLCGCGAPFAQTPQTPEVYCPWQYDVCTRAVEKGTLDYYFMSSEGNVVSESRQEPEKWGDCCLIVLPDGQTVLVDCGIAAFGPMLVENLTRMGVQRLDHIIITHPHRDHQEGIFHPDNLQDGVLARIAVGKVYHQGGLIPDYEGNHYVQEACRLQDIPLQVLQAGDTLTLGEAQLQVLWPKSGTAGREHIRTADMNNNSIVFRLELGDHSALFAGDLYDDGEFSLLSSQDTAVFDADLLKAPHHGGYTSGCEMFLKLVSPQLAVATGYGQLRDDARGRYEACRISLLDDFTYGYIHVSVSEGEMTWESSRQAPLPVDTAA